MKKTPLQWNAWWSSRQTCRELAPLVDSILQSTGFSVHGNLGQLHRPRRGSNIYGWHLVSLDANKAFFSLCGSDEGPWLHLQIHTRRRRSLEIFESLFTATLANLSPMECSIRISNTDDLPILARSWCLGGLGAVVDEDTEPPTLHCPGDPDWFQAEDPEIRFLANELLIRESLDPLTFASTTHRVATPAAHGFTFVGGSWCPR